MENLDFALNSLRNYGLKITPSRKSVLSYLVRSHGPHSVEEIHAGIRRKPCNITTIYRIVSNLEDLRLVRRLDLGDGVARYEYYCAEHPHHHLICKECKKLEIIEQDLLPTIEKAAKKQGFAQINPCVEFFGLCNECAS